MSVTYSIVCDDCKKTYWCGQDDYFYDHDLLNHYLKQHTGHKIRFLNDLVDDESTDYYDEFKDKG